MFSVPVLFVLITVSGINIAVVVAGYYIGVKHVDRMLDIEEGEADSEFPPGFGARESERLGPLSAEDIDEIDDWGDVGADRNANVTEGDTNTDDNDESGKD